MDVGWGTCWTRPVIPSYLSARSRNDKQMEDRLRAHGCGCGGGCGPGGEGGGESAVQF